MGDKIKLDGPVLECTSCCVCGTRFAVDEIIMANRRKNAGHIFCPNGHQIGWSDSDADKLRRERDLLKQQLAQRDDEIKRQKQLREDAEKTAAFRKGVVTRLRNRVAAGVCPCCNRTVSQMARHMAAKHPTYRAEEVA